jgi:hypothetical protein
MEELDIELCPFSQELLERIHVPMKGTRGH